eukprot:TCALIF_03209-PA protein Name:"Similar to Gulp1 PTB domain-containing engulfment adapter protein 1 (Rattus norvegicus)" AED:0.35 eAED:0.36 QI:285/0.5/0.33/1/0.75/1/9/0/764
MRNSSILKWAQNNKNNKLINGKKNDKKWIHQPAALQTGHVVYLVKFLGNTEVDKPKGIEVVKQGVQKLKFNQQLKKAEGGNSSAKTPKVEMTISVDGVTIQDPKSKAMMHQYPLHKISYCADDKAEKRFFSFIAKEGDTNRHTCFVFVSDKLAEEITLTIGQAFELAYKKFLDTSGKEKEVKRTQLVQQKRISLLEKENAELKKRLKDIANIKGPQDIQKYMNKNNITDICEVRINENDSTSLNGSLSNGGGNDNDSNHSAKKPEKDELINLDSANNKLDGFSLDDLHDDDFNPRAFAGNSDSDDTDEADFDPRAPKTEAPTLHPAPSAPVLISPPPAMPARAKSQNNFSDSLFSANEAVTKDPFNGDPFGMSTFESPVRSQTNALIGFQGGIKYPGEDYSSLKMRNSSILKWAQNNKNNKLSNGKKNDKKWIHQPEALQNGHVVYLVKFLGNTEVDKPKGIEVVKQGVQKLKFNQQLKKAEGGNSSAKTPKVEMTISVDGVTIQDPKSKAMMHQYPLHKISYCADDKAEKRFFSFIAKDNDSSRHTCFAEEITLTIGQAFELAYKKFLDTSGKEKEVKKAQLITEICEVRINENDSTSLNGSLSNGGGNDNDSNHSAKKPEKDELINLDSANNKLDGFSLDDLHDDDFNPRAFASNSDSDDTDEADFDPRAPKTEAPTLHPAPSAPVLISPPPAMPARAKSQNNFSDSLFSANEAVTKDPFNGDPFGMSTFESPVRSQTNALNGFQGGISMGNFSLDDLDPLK